jgi:thiol-disulfide isomerase/thioredoxin
MSGLWVTLVVFVVALALGVWWKVSNGRVSSVAKQSADQDAPSAALQRVIASQDSGGLGSQATLVQFSTAFCQPCRATRQILGEVTDMVDGVRHVEIDAESQLDLVRTLDIRRTPTVLILDASGAIRHRAVGQPRKADVIQALGAVID